MKRRFNSIAPSTLGLALAAALPCLASSTAANAAPAAQNETSAPPADSRRYSARGRGDRRDKWIHRWAPVRNMWEFGIYGGVWFPSKHLELFGPTMSGSGSGNQRLNTVAPDVGLRAAYFPLRFLGVEIEGGVMPTQTRSSDVSATAWALRAHVIGQLGLWSVTPFILAGTGLVGMQSASPPRGIGNDQDVAIHFGAGVKVFINRWVMLRLDVRDVVSNRAGVGEGLTSSPEILLGLSFTLRPKKKKARPRDDDRDGDRIVDKDDFCIDVYGPPPRGCPQVCIDDNDGDGLDNTEDTCIDDPETRNGFEDGDGCPDEVPPELSEIAGIMEGIQFDTDKDNIKSTSKPNIDNAAAVMKKYPSIRVRVVGHTDSQGAYKHNIDLSQRRAASVKRAMVEQGVEDSRIETAGVGPDQPIDTNETADGRAKNRRIEFQILEGAASKTVKKRGKKPPKDELPVEPTPEPKPDPTPEPAADAAKPVDPVAP
ncbi:MAG: OmpA family protein, partial [Deltaproteobacteria bacterium]|nr:OmpA family protein [Nannocystaceae bacterium]